ncbi:MULTISPECIES: GntR family transcriptional regulator [unclassified Halomonas]|uniref:GntR family transcriptional regulator n=1 Tax=Halomonas sp. H10-59 TaxID=2950874 RepID=A0AAU7KX91_9GAMM|nr:MULTISPECIES: GntR family transcriptional regulator [unclassified Halomonas]MBR9881437.1 GntR family transcriptional regulator [Gammaproteobacteria bacterium]MAR73641.1 GntR family transcriptional regulator [Halomonas sp.]MBY6109173.1 GntR family transcriptional regulator [Halomonas sp. DP1Y21-3]MCJ8283882.1 GntR family transcriptional regulator [Halomonas sp.]NQY68935.1 GntR family transcriptional regulator [Halomonas sp.]|tara:strand:- start:7100 stop:7822 length:723 start_codon:yes stop_codon:yes gene_type:complete
MDQPSLSYRPLYQQIKEVLLQRIVSGEWAPGTFIPSESALAKEYQVSVGTLRKALDSLASDNVVIRYQGKGTVVATHDQDSSLFRFFHLTRLDGSRSLPTSRILVRERRPANEEEMEVLGLEDADDVIHIRRVRELDERPALLEDVVVAATRFPTLESLPETLPNTLYQLYQQRFGCNVSHAEERLFAVAAGKDEAHHLEIAEGSPILEIRRVARDIQEQALEYRVSRCETRHHCYFNEL